MSQSSLKVNTELVFEPMGVNSAAALRKLVRSRFHVELGAFTLHFEESCQAAAKPTVLEFVNRLISWMR